MRKPTAVVDVDVTSASDVTGLDRYGNARILIRLAGTPVTFATLPVLNGRLDRAALGRYLVSKETAFLKPLVRSAIAHAQFRDRFDIEAALASTRRPRTGREPKVTVAVCTRNRTAELTSCLESLIRIDYPNIDLLVVDNDPSNDSTERLVRESYPHIRYVREPRPGLDWARNRAILESRGELLAFTDDDVVVDPGWVDRLVEPFEADPAVMAVTGLVIPHELETDAQRMFETYGGFGRGLVRRWYRAPAGRPVALLHGGTGRFGTGANMAYRLSVFDSIGGFDPALDVGTCTNGGGDLEMFFRVLKAGHTLVYAPAAVVRHRHRRSYAELRTQIRNNGVGFYAYLWRSYHASPDERAAFLRLGLWWFRWWHFRRLRRSLMGRERIPRDLIVTELAGSLVGLVRYPRAAARAAQVAAAFPAEPQLPPRLPAVANAPRRAEAIRTVDVGEPLTPITDVTDYERVRVVVLWRGEALGAVTVDHHGASVNVEWLADAIAEQLTHRIVDVAKYPSRVKATAMARSLAGLFGLERELENRTAPALPSEVAVSVVVATRDRPADLRRCLESLCAQRTDRRVEIVVVDNSQGGSPGQEPADGTGSPAESSKPSGIASVTRDFPGVVLVSEPRAGLSYARNRGIAAATGDIIVTTDDDVTCPADWIERLIAPFVRPDVMAVTGNVLPAELETEAQRLFESYGGLGRGFTRIVADRDWFSRGRRAVPTWKLGCTANAAFRASIFADPDIGLMNEALGAGTPTGCSEDTYTFYRVLKAGHAIVYEPSAIVWHHHRQTIGALRRQIFSYSKGHVAYHLTTWLVDGDRRALVRLGYELPRTYMRRAWLRLRRRSDYPLSFIGLEILGCLAGPLSLWRSRRRVRRLGRTERLPERRPYGVQLESPCAQVTKT